MPQGSNDRAASGVCAGTGDVGGSVDAATSVGWAVWPSAVEAGATASSGSEGCSYAIGVVAAATLP
jgi:hypothetical protein